MLRLAAEVPDFFAINGDLAVRLGQGFGCECANCGRKISAPHGYERKLVWCLYCGMKEGHVPMIEPAWGFRWQFGVTREECVEDRASLERGSLYEDTEARARREGRVLDIF